MQSREQERVQPASCLTLILLTMYSAAYSVLLHWMAN